MSFSSNRTKPNNVNLNDTQTLDNKTLTGNTVIQDGATITKPDIIDPDRLDVKKGLLDDLQTYAATATEGQLCYATDVKKMYQIKNSALAEVGSGSSGVNYIANPDFEVNLDGWNEAASNITLELESVAPLRGTKSLKLTKLSGASRAGQFIATDAFTIDTADLAKKLTGSFDYDFSDVDYADGHARIEIEADPAGTPQTIRVNGEDIKAGKGKHYFQFQTDATITDYRLKIVWQDATDSEVVAYIDDVQVGPRELAYGTVVTDGEIFSPTASDATGVFTNSASYSRVGKYLFVDGEVTWSGAGAGTTFTVSLPSGLSIDNTALVQDGAISSIGSAAWLDNGTSQKVLTTAYASATTVKFIEGSVGFWDGSQAASGDILTYQYKVPIQGWSSNAQISEDLGGRDIVTRVQRSTNQLIGDNSFTPIVFDSTPITDTVSAFNGASLITIQESGYYDILGHIYFATNATGARGSRIYIDGITIEKQISIAAAPGGGVTTQHDIASKGIYLNKGQTVSLYAYQTSGGNLNLTSAKLSVVKLASPQTMLETETVAYIGESNFGLNLPTETWTPMVWEDVIKSTHGPSMYNASTGVFTAPVSGFYMVNAFATINNSDVVAGGKTRIAAYLNNVEYLVYINEHEGSAQIQVSLPLNFTVYMNKGDTLDFELYHDEGGPLLVLANHDYNKLSIIRIK